MTYAKIDITPDGSLAFRSSYDPDLVDALKREIPYSDRRWDPDRKRWLVTVDHAGTLEQISERYLGVRPRTQTSYVPADPPKETKLLKVDYIGAPKERSDGSVSAFGYCEGGWNVVFPQDVLKNWFELGGMPEQSAAPAGTSTLYGLLGVARDADDAAIKRAWRKMAKRWHPDVSDEPDAAEMMQRINDAYEVLGDPKMRRKYDAGLKLEASLKEEPRERSRLPKWGNTWRPPIRCGYIMAEGVSQIGRFYVERILQWEDVVDAHGRVMVTSWPAGADHFTVKWA